MGGKSSLPGLHPIVTSVARQWWIVSLTAAALNFNSSISGAFAHTASLAAPSCSTLSSISASPSPWRNTSKGERYDKLTAT